MPNIKPISDLRNYTAVLDTVAIGSPVYLTKNGRGCFTIMDIQEQEEQQKKAQKYEKMEAQLKLMCELNAGRKSGEEEGWISELLKFTVALLTFLSRSSKISRNEVPVRE